MGAATVPNENKSTGQMASQVLEEVQHLFGSYVMGMQGPVEIESLPLGRNAEGADGGESVTAVPLTENRRLPAGRPGPADQRLKHKPALVDKDDRSTCPFGVFLYGAIVGYAIVGSSLRRARGLGAPVSDSSIPPLGESSRRGRDDNEPRRCWR
jgi:hypothetical protein